MSKALDQLEAMAVGEEVVDGRGRRWRRDDSGWVSGIRYASSAWLLEYERVMVESWAPSFEHQFD